MVDHKQGYQAVTECNGLTINVITEGSAEDAAFEMVGQVLNDLGC